jgi:hypothetical protein
MPAEPIAEQVAGLEPAMAAKIAHIGDTQATRHAAHPDMQRRIEILAGTAAAYRGAFEDEERDREQGDRGHFLVDILRHRIERCRRHEDDHENGRHQAQCEGDRHAGEHGDQCGPAIEQADGQDAHVRRTTCTRICSVSSDMPSAIIE